MAQQIERTFAPRDPFPSDWANAVAGLLAAAEHSFVVQIKPGDPTTLQVPALGDANNPRVGLSVEGRWRWLDATIEAAGPGGAAQTFDVYATAADNVFTPGSPGEFDNTNRTPALAIVASGATPSAVLARLVAQAHWTGSAFDYVDNLLGAWSGQARHAAQHASGGPDAITPGAIGAAPAAAGAFIGALVDYAGSADPSSSWLIADGRALRRDTYSDLFAVIGTTFGAGDGSTTFNIPDTRGRTTVGAGAGPGLSNRARGSKFGEETHTLTLPETPAHNHTATDSGHAHGTTDPGHSHHTGSGTGFLTDAGGWQYLFSASGPAADVIFIGRFGDTDSRFTGVSINTDHAHVTIGNAGGGGGHNNMQPSIALNKIIRVL